MKVPPLPSYDETRLIELTENSNMYPPIHVFIPPPPSYNETTETAPTYSYNNVYPSISEFNDQQTLLQPLIEVPPQYNELSSQNVNAPNPQANPNIDQVLGRYPQQAYCPTCKQNNLTEVKYEPSFCTIKWVILCITSGLVFCFCLIPFWINSFKDCQHFCTQCYNYIGTYSRSPDENYRTNIIIIWIFLLIFGLILYSSFFDNNINKNRSV